MDNRIIPVPFVDLTRQYQELKEEIDAAIMKVLSGGQFILGSEVSSFEKEMAAYLGVGYAIGVASGTDALFLILKALGIGPGDQVITPTFTFVATAETIANCGAEPVFADIDPRTFNLSTDSCLEQITDRTKAIIIVHLFGQPAELDHIRSLATSKGIHLIEDCAQAAGAEYKGKKVGSFGNAAAFSFFPTKNLGAIGDGGLVATSDRQIADKVLELRNHGSRQKYYHESVGFNSRLDEVQAAVLRVKLRHLDRWNCERRKIAGRYDECFGQEMAPFVDSSVNHVYHQYTIRSKNRNGLMASLADSGIGFNVYYPLPLHLQPCFRGLGYNPCAFPLSEKASSEVLSLPIFTGLLPEEIESVCSALRR
jgi:dTDP-4-amino-4,6-dideoxygalactose transaminase